MRYAYNVRGGERITEEEVFYRRVPEKGKYDPIGEYHRGKERRGE